MRTLAFVLTLAALFLPACERKPQPTVVLYSSIDAGTIRPILDTYTARTGVKIDLVTDTEATKTTGLVQRLLSERDTPGGRADVWWSGEAVGTVQLSRAGSLTPYNSMAAESAARAGSLPGWPDQFRGPKGDWYGLALRPRAIVFNTSNYPSSPPRSLQALADTKTSKPVAIANPAFGTTRGHLAALYLQLGREAFVDLMSRIKWRVVDGNAAVVRAVANGECDLGITDYDDYHAGLANKWPIGCVLVTISQENPTLIVTTPGTIALVAGAPHPELAKAFIDELLSVSTEQTLASGDWASMPVLKGVTVPQDRFDGVAPAPIDWTKAADFLDQAAAAWTESQKKK